MASLVVDGLVLPVRVGGHPAVDFCNTRAGWDSPGPKEYLRDHRHLALWAREAGLTPTAVAARPARTAAAVLDRALALRTALYDVLVGSATPGSWAVVTDEVAEAHARARLRPVGDADRRVPIAPAALAPARWELPGTGPDAPLSAIAWSVGEFLTSVPAGAVLACPGVGCGWLFHDPRGRRRWCSMAWCGNRAKVRRHADRRRPDAELGGDS